MHLFNTIRLPSAPIAPATRAPAVCLQCCPFLHHSLLPIHSVWAWRGLHRGQFTQYHLELVLMCGTFLMTLVYYATAVMRSAASCLHVEHCQLGFFSFCLWAHDIVQWGVMVTFSELMRLIQSSNRLGRVLTSEFLVIFYCFISLLCYIKCRLSISSR